MAHLLVLIVRIDYRRTGSAISLVNTCSRSLRHTEAEIDFRAFSVSRFSLPSG